MNRKKFSALVISVMMLAEAEEETGRETTGTGNTGAVYSTNIVRTGDESGIILWSAVLLTSLFILVILITARVRYNSERRY